MIATDSGRHFLGTMRGMLLLLVLVVLLPLLVVQAGIYVAWYYSRWAEEEQEDLRAAWGVAATFDDYVENVRRQEWAIGQALEGLNPYTAEQANAFLAANTRVYPLVRSWHWVSPEGKIIGSSDPRTIGLDIADRAHFQKVRDGEPWAISDILSDKAYGIPDFFIACRINDSEGKLYGVVTATIRPGAFEAKLVAQHRAEHGDAAIFDSQGVLVYSSWKENSALQNWRERDPLLAAVLKSHENRSGLLTVPPDDQPCIAARVPISNTGWVAGSRRPVKVALANVYSGLWIAAGLNALVAAGSGGLALTTSGTLIRQLRRLQSHAQAIGRGELEHRTEAAGVREIAELAAAFNQMGASIHAAQQELERLASFPRLNPCPITEVDLSGRVHFVNPVARQLFPDLQQREQSHPWLADWDSAARQFQNGDARIVGREVMVDNRCYQQTMHYVTENERVRIYGMEITERKQAEEGLKRAAAQLARSNEELEQFAYVASHDLQEPLRVVTGYVQLIARKYKGRLDADADQFFAYIVDGVARMQQLITDLLEFSRVGTRGNPFERTNVRDVLDRVRANLQGIIGENGAVLTYADPLPDVHADETQLVQLFQNLIANGIKFRSDRPPQVDVSARRDGDRWVFAVRDNGIGIEPQYWEQIFVIFQRLHTRQKYAGTGIGLAVCKRIVERHGGRIWLDSQPGQGTTFYFTLS